METASGSMSSNLLFLLNATVNSTTGESLHYIITGQQTNISLPKLPHNELANHSLTACKLTPTHHFG